MEITPEDGGTYALRDVGSLNGTYVNRERIDEVELVPGRRGADRQVQARLPGGWERVSSRTLPLHRGRPDAAARGVPRRHHLEDPLPREPGPGEPRALAVGLPQVLRPRRRAPALGAAPAAGALPAAQGDPGPPGRRRARRRPARPTSANGKPAEPRRCRPPTVAPARGDGPRHPEQPAKADEEAMARILADAVPAGRPPARGGAGPPRACRSSPSARTRRSRDHRSAGDPVAAGGGVGPRAAAARGGAPDDPRPRRPARRSRHAGRPEGDGRRRERAAPTGLAVAPRAEAAASATTAAFQPPDEAKARREPGSRQYRCRRRSPTRRPAPAAMVDRRQPDRRGARAPPAACRSRRWPASWGSG